MDDIRSITSSNIFDNLPSTGPIDANTIDDELEDYFGTPREHVTDVIRWWYDRRSTWPRLSRMALDYLSVPGMS